MFFDMYFGMLPFPIAVEHPKIHYRSFTIISRLMIGRFNGCSAGFRFGLTLRSAQGQQNLKGGHDWNGVIPVGIAVVFPRWSDRRHDGAGRVLCLSGAKCFENEETQGKWRGNAMEGENSGNWELHVGEFFCIYPSRNCR